LRQLLHGCRDRTFLHVRHRDCLVGACATARSAAFSIGALTVRALTFGALTFDALTFGALAIGALAIGALTFGALTVGTDTRGTFSIGTRSGDGRRGPLFGRACGCGTTAIVFGAGTFIGRLIGGLSRKRDSQGRGGTKDKQNTQILHHTKNSINTT
jgi:hypothetical protein